MKNITNRTRLSAAIALVVAGVSTPSASFANEAITLEEVVVTAQKREQNLQDVPVAVTAFDSAALEKSGIQDVTELQKKAPNVTMQVSRGTNSTLTAYVRGIGQADPLWGFEPGVGLYVDDIYLSRPQGGVLDVFDVERIEVLRGPQGTLYGKNTIGGAVKYVTKRLTGEPELSLNAAVGSYNQRDLKVSGQLPLIEDKLFFGASVAKFERDGFGEFLQSGDDNYNKDLMAARVSLEFLPTDDVSVRFSADKTKDDSNAKGGYRMTQSLLNPAEANPSDVFDSNADMDTKNSVESSGTSVIVAWDVNENYTFKSISSYREGDTFTNIDFDNTSLASLHVPAIYSDDQITQEFQISYSGDDLDVVGGIYYYEGTASGAFDVLLGAFNPSGAFDPSTGEFNALTAGTVDTTSYAAYIHATWVISEALSLTLGGRYTQDEKEAEVYKAAMYVDGMSSQLGGTTLSILGAPSTDYNNDESWNQFSPKVSVDYSFRDGLMGYASYSQGFKSGGFDMRGDATKNPDTVNGYDPEIADTYEVGVKSELFDGRVRVNAAAFYTDYTDMQVTVQQSSDGGSNFVSSVLNAGSADIRGFEVEAMAQVTDHLSATLMAGYINAEYEEVENQTAAGVEDIADQWSFANTPEKVASVSLNYDRTLDQGGDISISVGASYRSETQIFPQVESLIDENSYTLWDASAVWYSPDEHWTVGLHGKNLTNEEYRVGGYNFANLGLEESVIGYYGNPRTVSLNLGYTF